MNFKLTVGLALQVSGALAFWRMECPAPVGNVRLDPLVSPGQISQHAHIVYGSSGFSASSGANELLGGDCTSCRVTNDKSAYWTPKLYFRDAGTGELEEVPQLGLLAYYFLNKEPLHPDRGITAFPNGLQMIAGSSTRRTFTAPFDPLGPDPEQSIWGLLGLTTQENLAQLAIGFNCLNYGREGERTLSRHFLPDKEYIDANCPNGIRAELMFPACGKRDGNGNIVLASPDHKSHVAYPDLVMTGNCPDGFDVRFPGLMFETHYYTAAFAGRAGSFVGANGDPKGYGYHGDFIAAWQDGVLQRAVDVCTSDSGKIEDCGEFNLVDKDTASQCKMKIPDMLMNENVVGPLGSLPGNVLITYEDGKPGPAPAAQPYSSDPADTYQPGGIFKESSIYEDNSPAASGAKAAAEEPAPAVTSPPEIADVGDHNVVSTQFVTNGPVVSMILWEEITVYETVTADVTTTMYQSAAAAKVKRHAHRHAHHRH